MTLVVMLLRPACILTGVYGMNFQVGFAFSRSLYDDATSNAYVHCIHMII
jgi:Mg2+ and Co2+ transporter CorA